MSVGRLPPVVQITATADRRGAEVFASDLHAELVARGWPLTTVALVPGGREPSLPLKALGRRPFAPSTIASLSRLIRGNAGAVAHGSSTLPATLVAAGLTNRPWIYRSIGDPRYWQRSGFVRQRVRLQLATASRVVVLWKAAADALVAGGVSGRRIVVIPNGVPAARFPLVDAGLAAEARTALDPEGRIDGPVAIFVGSLSSEKGLDTAIQAVSRLPELHLVVLGDGPLRTEYMDLGNRLASGRVWFLGITDRPGQIFAAADVVLVPSRTEGMAAVLIEAGLSGIPVVATDVGAAREVVLPGESGVLVPPGDPARLADGIREALGGSLGGPVAREWCIRHFDLPEIADAWADLLLGLLGDGHTTR